jgi:AraC family transcriptional regulator
LRSLTFGKGTRVSLARRAAWVVERHLGAELSLASLAAATGVTPCHLAHAFAEATGQPLMAYVRARRLSEAAAAVAGGAVDLLDLALVSGYASHAAFTRAFKSRFGLPPAALRRRGTLAGLSCQAPLPVADDGVPAALEAPVVRPREARLYAGIGGRFTFDALEGIPALWRRFAARCGAAGGTPVGLCGPMPDGTRLLYTCAVELAAGAPAPPGLTRVAVPAGDYAVVLHRGHVVTLRATYRAMLDVVLPARGLTLRPAPCEEHHPASFDAGTGAGGIELWFPVRRAGPGQICSLPA